MKSSKMRISKGNKNNDYIITENEKSVNIIFFISLLQKFWI